MTGNRPAPRLTAVFQKVQAGCVTFVAELPGAHTQGATLEAARTKLQKAVALVLEANRLLAEEKLEAFALSA
ncbi:protein of unknown function UPF0150 [Truepera radiovictrix DSM 17093]|uniref:HicB family protein n=1 Tax=Truepera radiovictrix (strain DSM 17093 / CIP 108686 / LMG 22925 / RQ-24) TaxID=649638 RepID=D7CV87_TRURR|nr:protein of unknown function UPF0150 [Truepera radiovictrix DSM 17093]